MPLIVQDDRPRGNPRHRPQAITTTAEYPDLTIPRLPW
jgi:hypothetical protein